MNWKDIAVFADGSADGVARLGMAIALASDDAKVLAHVLSLQPMSPYGVGAPALWDAYADACAAAREAGAGIVAQLRAASADAGERVLVQQHDVTAADVRNAAAVMAREADLVVLGQPEEGDRSSVDTDILVGALLGGGRPVLMLPRWQQPHAWGKRAVIAWKGAPQCARAVHDALPFLRRAESVRILAADSRGDAYGEGQHTLQRLSLHLARHGVKVHEALMSDADGEADRAVLSEVESFGADLLVMGGYGRSRLSEIVWGGVTASIIRKASVAVLMSH
jgi:nucleotide-binding universal stress UspA family protein